MGKFKYSGGKLEEISCVLSVRVVYYIILYSMVIFCKVTYGVGVRLSRAFFFLEVGGIKSRLSYGLYSRNGLVVLLSHVEV